MTGQTEVTVADPTDMPVARPVGRHRRRGALIVVGLAVAAMAVLAATGTFTATGKPSSAGADNSSPTTLTTLHRQDLSAQTDVQATLGYAGNASVVNEAQGTITALPSVGQVIGQNQVLYQVNGSPVILLYGSTPAYRTLSEDAYASGVTGPDVAELNADLVTLGYATTSEIPAGSDEFTWWTKDALEKLQAHLGVTQTGTLTLGQAVFLPTAVRVASVSATLGATAAPGQAVLTATSATRQVTIALDASQESEVAVGDKVTITLPNNQATPGVITSVGNVASTPSGGGTPTITVEVTPTDPAATGTLDQAPVEVAITTGSVTNALVAPVDALLALSGGGYAVEVVDSAGIHHLVPVSLGLFDDADGLVQVTGSGLSAGERIVVPAL